MTKPNQMMTVKVAGVEREIEVRHWFTSDPSAKIQAEGWKSTSQVVLVKIGHGTKLWATSLLIWVYPDGKIQVKPMTVNNRNNLTLVSWNDIVKTDSKRSQHKGQYTK